MHPEVLLTPGPVMMHERVVRAQAVQAVSHRSEEFRRVLDEVRSLMAKVAGGGEPLVLTGSGTLAVESMAWSLTRPGDNVLVVVNGEFGERLADTLRRRGAVVTMLESPGPGKPVEPGLVLDQVETRAYDAVAVVYTETSMGLSYRDIEKIAEAAHAAGAKVLVDAVSALGGEVVPPPCRVDAVATASQKALAGPPGLGFVLLCPEEADRLEHRGAPGPVPNYLDLSKVVRFHRQRRETPFTPAVTLLNAMAEALRVIVEYGVERWLNRHRVRAGRLYSRMPLEPLVEDEHYRAWTLAAFRTPVPSAALTEALASRGIRVARGMGELKDHVVRISTMGWSPDEVFDQLPSIVEEALSELTRQTAKT